MRPDSYFLVKCQCGRMRLGTVYGKRYDASRLQFQRNTTAWGHSEDPTTSEGCSYCGDDKINTWYPTTVLLMDPDRKFAVTRLIGMSDPTQVQQTVITTLTSNGYKEIFSDKRFKRVFQKNDAEVAYIDNGYQQRKTFDIYFVGESTDLVLQQIQDYLKSQRALIVRVRKPPTVESKDSLHQTIVIGNWVAYYDKDVKKMKFAEVVKFRDDRIVLDTRKQIRRGSKSTTISKKSQEIIKIDSERAAQVLMLETLSK